jgi:hypothetical protein
MTKSENETETPRYPGCQIYPHNGNFQIAWPNGNPKWEGGIEWLAAFRELKDAEDFVSKHGRDA